jgi:hypothetical protein
LNTKATFSSFIYSEQVTITLIDDGSTHSRRQRKIKDENVALVFKVQSYDVFFQLYANVHE